MQNVLNLDDLVAQAIKGANSTNSSVTANPAPSQQQRESVALPSTPDWPPNEPDEEWDDGTVERLSLPTAAGKYPLVMYVRKVIKPQTDSNIIDNDDPRYTRAIWTHLPI